jgi:hypothetical protein
VLRALEARREAECRGELGQHKAGDGPGRRTA